MSALIEELERELSMIRLYPDKTITTHSLMNYPPPTLEQWEKSKQVMLSNGWSLLPVWLRRETCYFGQGWSVMMWRDREVDYCI